MNPSASSDLCLIVDDDVELVIPDNVLTFGRHNLKTIEWVIENDIDYFKWLLFNQSEYSKLGKLIRTDKYLDMYNARFRRDEDVMPGGVYEGKTINWIIDNDIDYYSDLLTKYKKNNRYTTFGKMIYKEEYMNRYISIIRGRMGILQKHSDDCLIE